MELYLHCAICQHGVVLSQAQYFFAITLTIERLTLA